jgi:hypothetical protein
MLNRAEMQPALAALEQKAIDLAQLITLGKQLTNQLLPDGPIRHRLINLVKQVGRDHAVRLRVLARHPTLAQLPWEYCYLPIHMGQADRSHFLCLHPQLSIVRHVPLDDAYPSLQPADSNQLRVVAALVNAAGYPELKLLKERKVLEKALRNFAVDGITVAWEPVIEDVTRDDLLTRLQQKADIFHFAGHGEFRLTDVDFETGEGIGEGSLILIEDKASKAPERLKAADLALQLQHAGVRIAVLGACDSGRHDSVSAWTGIGPALIGRGLPAVVAMQYELVDTQAVTFTQAFYTALIAGLSVDEAMAAARLAMLGKAEDDDIEWGVPVLYMRSSNGVIFPNDAEPDDNTAAQIRRVVRQVVDTIHEGGTVIGIRSAAAKGSYEIVQQAKNVSGSMIGWSDQ